MYRVFEALDELSAIVEEARGVPMTAGCVVPRGDVLELIDDIKGRSLVYAWHPSMLVPALAAAGTRTAS